VRFLTLPLFWVRLRALTSFERAFEPSFPIERDFEPSLPFERAFEPSFSFFFFTWVGHPLQWDPFICICPKKKQFPCFILHRAGRLEQLDHSRNPFRVLLFLSGRSPGTIWSLTKPFLRFILPIGQVTWNNLTTRETLFAFYSLSGRSPGTIWPLVKPFLHFIFPIGQVTWNN